MAQNQNVNIKATVSVDDSGVKQYNQTLEKTEQATEKAFNPKRALREANLELIKAQEQFGTYSAEAVKAAQKVAGLRDQIQDASEVAALFDPGKKFAAYSNALQSVAGAFAGVQGAIGLLGVESEEVQQQLLKVQSALALSEGLSTIGDIGKNFGELATVIKTQVVGAFNALKAAIGSTGIGLLVIALGTIVAYWDDIKEAVSGVSEEQKKLNADTEANVKAQQQKLDAIGGQENILKLQGKSEKEILQLKVKQTDEVIAATEEQIRQNEITLKGQIAAEKRNREILQGILNFSLEASLLPIRIIAAPLDLLVKTVNGVAESLGFAKITTLNLNDEITKLKNQGVDKLTSFVFDPAKTAADGNKAIAEQRKTLDKLKNDRAGYLLEIQDIDKQAADERLKKDKEAQDKALAQEKEALKKRREAQLEANAGIAASSEAIVSKQKEFLNNQNNLIVKGSDDALKAFGKSVSEQNKKAIELANANDERNKLELAREQEKQKAYQMTGEALVALSDVVGRQTAAGKALAISQALINTYQGITQIWKNDTVIPEPFGTIQKVAATITAAASGFSAVRNIARVQVPGGGGGGGNIPAGAGGAAPLSPQAPQALTTQLDQRSINSITSTTTRAYVIESDVTNSQARISRINRAATFG